MYYIKKIVPIVLLTIFYSCSSSKPEATMQLSKNSKKKNTRPSKLKKNIYPSSQKTNVQKDNKLKNWQKVDFDKLESDYFSNSVKPDKKINKIEIIQNKTKNVETLSEKVSTKAKIETTSKLNTNLKNGYSNSLRVKTVYEIATETQPNLFLLHDEFETAREYKTRVTEQVKLMKEIVLMTSQKMDIRNAQRIKIAKDDERKATQILNIQLICLIIQVVMLKVDLALDSFYKF